MLLEAAKKNCLAVADLRVPSNDSGINCGTQFVGSTDFWPPKSAPGTADHYIHIHVNHPQVKPK